DQHSFVQHTFDQHTPHVAAYPCFRSTTYGLHTPHAAADLHNHVAAVLPAVSDPNHGVDDQNSDVDYAGLQNAETHALLPCCIATETAHVGRDRMRLAGPNP
ncbi:hypothetical protein A2U01_0071200, partial [Trifolium medium]|nr:hypothetical protein [Trifolium medium]